MENKYVVRILIEILKNVNKKNDKKRLVKLLRYYIRSRKGSVRVPGLMNIINECHMNKTDNADEFYDKVFERVDKGVYCSFKIERFYLSNYFVK